MNPIDYIEEKVNQHIFEKYYDGYIHLMYSIYAMKKVGIPNADHVLDLFYESLKIPKGEKDICEKMMKDERVYKQIKDNFIHHPANVTFFGKLDSVEINPLLWEKEKSEILKLIQERDVLEISIKQLKSKKLGKELEKQELRLKKIEEKLGKYKYHVLNRRFSDLFADLNEKINGYLIEPLHINPTIGICMPREVLALLSTTKKCSDFMWYFSHMEFSSKIMLNVTSQLDPLQKSATAFNDKISHFLNIPIVGTYFSKPILNKTLELIDSAIGVAIKSFLPIEEENKLINSLVMKIINYIAAYKLPEVALAQWEQGRRVTEPVEFYQKENFPFLEPFINTISSLDVSKLKENVPSLKIYETGYYDVAFEFLALFEQGLEKIAPPLPIENYNHFKDKINTIRNWYQKSPKGKRSEALYEQFDKLLDEISNVTANPQNLLAPEYLALVKNMLFSLAEAKTFLTGQDSLLKFMPQIQKIEQTLGEKIGQYLNNNFLMFKLWNERFDIEKNRTRIETLPAIQQNTTSMKSALPKTATTLLFSQPAAETKISSEIGVECTKTLFLFSSGGAGHKSAMEAKKQMVLEREVSNAWNELNKEQQDLQKRADLTIAEEQRLAELNQASENRKGYSDINTLPEDYKNRLKNLSFQIHDLLVDWLPGVGQMAVDTFNQAMKEQNIEKVQAMQKMQVLTDELMGPLIYTKTINALRSNPNIEVIVDTQPMCTKQICQAVEFVNKKDGRNIKVKKVMTDLPTPLATHFFSGLKSLEPGERAVITVETVHPLLPEVAKGKQVVESIESQENAFWQENCGEINVEYTTRPPVRKEFLPENHRSRAKIEQEEYLSFQWNFDAEKKLMQEINPDKSYLEFDDKTKQGKIQIKPNELVVSIMIGSQGSAAIKEYMNQVIDYAKKHPNAPNIYFIPYCSSDATDASLLFNEIAANVKGQMEKRAMPHNLRVLPLGKQSALTVAETNERSDIAVIKPGGLSSMEIALCCPKRENAPTTKVYIHAEGTEHTDDQQKMLESIRPDWERGNAQFLLQKIDAQVGNIRTFEKALDEVAQKRQNLQRRATN